MSLPVRFTSILFERPEDAAKQAETSFFTDLNLDQVFSAVAAGRDEYDLAPFFGIPLRNVRSVEYRHHVLRDLEDQAVSEAIAGFAERMGEMRKHLAQAGKLRYRYQKEHWFLGAASIYCDAVSALADVLATSELESRGFTAFRDYLAGYAQSAEFTDLVADIRRVASALATVRYCINIKDARVRVTRYDGEADYSAEVVTTFAKFARGAVKSYRVGFRNRPDMDHVEERILSLVARLYPEVFGALDDFCARHAGVYVTFVDELASLNEACVSMVGTVVPDSPAERTYKVLRLTEAGVRVVFVTHLYDLAERCYVENTGTSLFLRAERRPDGRRTFRLLEGEPLPTSFGQDVYQQVFGTAYETAHA